ncbi:MAG TPA: hypothetical protein DCP31_28260, partial [Cyanobacteria bacterium UBA8543]|nr:hypothetical protein [Cyanobacteria bacterium UBA8543]
MDETFQSSQEWLQEILQSFNDVAWSADATTWETLFLSQSAQIVYGRSVAEFYDNCHLWRSLIHPDDRPWVETQIPVLFSTGVLDLEYRILRPSGEVRWLEHRLRLIRDAFGEAKRIDGMARDITERHQAEETRQTTNNNLETQAINLASANQELQSTLEALRESEERFRAIFEQAAVGICQSSLDGQFLRLNQKFCNLLGYTQEEMLNRTWMDITHPKDIQADLDALCRLTQGEIDHYILEKRYVRKDGSIIWVNLSCSLVWESSGEVKFAIAVVKDISDRIRTQKALQRSQERFRNLVETTSDWVWEVDEHGFYTYVSPKVEDLLGYTVQELQDKTPFDFMPYRDACRMTNFYRQLITVQDPFSCLESTRIHKDGHLVVMETSGVPVFDAEGKFCGYRGISRDITERKRMEVALKENQQKYKTLFEILPIGISITNEKGKIIEVNPASEQILGLSNAESSRRRYDSPEWQIVRPDGTPMPVSEFPCARVFAENKVITNVELGMVKPDGEITWLAVTAAPIPLSGYGVAIAYTDISEQKQAEETLRSQAQREQLIGLITQRIRQS